MRRDIRRGISPGFDVDADVAAARDRAGHEAGCSRYAEPNGRGMARAELGLAVLADLELEIARRRIDLGREREPDQDSFGQESAALGHVGESTRPRDLARRHDRLRATQNRGIFEKRRRHEPHADGR